VNIYVYIGRWVYTRARGVGGGLQRLQRPRVLAAPHRSDQRRKRGEPEGATEKEREKERERERERERGVGEGDQGKRRIARDESERRTCDESAAL